MEKEIITMYELMGLIKDGKAPKIIKYNDIEFYWDGKSYKNDDWDYLSVYISDIDDIKIVELDVEILPEENDEWEDIENYQYSIIPSYFELKSVIECINENFEKHQKALISIVKNQKYLKEKLEVKDESQRISKKLF